jgi:hypothetical protein
VNDLVGLREAVVESFKAKLGAGVKVESHGGSFDLAELKRYAQKAPAVAVAIVGVGRASRFTDGRWKLPVHFSAVAITVDRAGEAGKIGRDVAGLALVGAIELSLASNRFGLEGVMQPEDVQGRNEYSGPLDQLGIALWQVTWTSCVLLGSEYDQDPVIPQLMQLVVGGETWWTQANGLVNDPSAPGEGA